MSFNNTNLAASKSYNGYLKFSQQSLLYSHSVTLPEINAKKENAKIKTCTKINHINFTGGKKQYFAKKERFAADSSFTSS